jgi:hypothetical protein
MATYETPVPSEVPTVSAWNIVASYPTYADAQRAVDHLASVAFPVNEIEIVGSGLRTVERVTGPMTWGRAMAGGAGTGAWIGLFVGLLVGLFSSGAVWLGLLLGGLLIGAVWGAILGAAARHLSGGHHNFSSLRSVVATRYDVIALDGMANSARQALGVGAPPPSFSPPA